MSQTGRAVGGCDFIAFFFQKCILCREFGVIDRRSLQMQAVLVLAFDVQRPSHDGFRCTH